MRAVLTWMLLGGATAGLGWIGWSYLSKDGVRDDRSGATVVVEQRTALGLAPDASGAQDRADGATGATDGGFDDQPAPLSARLDTNTETDEPSTVPADDAKAAPLDASDATASDASDTAATANVDSSSAKDAASNDTASKDSAPTEVTLEPENSGQDLVKAEDGNQKPDPAVTEQPGGETEAGTSAGATASSDTPSSDTQSVDPANAEPAKATANAGAPSSDGPDGEPRLTVAEPDSPQLGANDATTTVQSEPNVTQSLDQQGLADPGQSEQAADPNNGADVDDAIAADDPAALADRAKSADKATVESSADAKDTARIDDPVQPKDPAAAEDTIAADDPAAAVDTVAAEDNASADDPASAPSQSTPGTITASEDGGAPGALASVDPEATAGERADPANDRSTEQDGGQPDNVPTVPDTGDASDGTATETSNVGADTEPDRPGVPALPNIGLIRVEADGQTLVLGAAEPKTRVEILLDGAVIGDATTDESGAFVASVSSSFSGRPQSLQVRSPAPTAPKKSGSSDRKPDVAEGQLPDAEPARSAALIEPDRAVSPKVLSAPDDDAAGLAVGGSDLTPQAPKSVPNEPKSPAESVAAIAAVPAAPAGTPVKVPAATGLDLTPPPSVAPEEDRTAHQSDVKPPPRRASTASEPLETGAGHVTIDMPDAPDEVQTGKYLISAPVIILPADIAEDAPALVQPREEGLALIQPTGADIRRVMLDRISYAQAGDLQLSGRGRPGRVVRVYGNRAFLAEVLVKEDGTWATSVPLSQGRDVKLFRFDEIGQSGKVTSRIETPFTYASDSPQIVREREVTVQRGDMLWRIAEQYYGEGLRYSLIYQANGALIRDPDLIYPGQVFAIPELVDAPSSSQ